MKKYKKLIAGIIFLAFQVAVIIIKGIPKTAPGINESGYLIGYMATGIIGLAFIVAFVIEKVKTK